MSDRIEPTGDDAVDDFPTPRWATRALLKHAMFDPTIRSGSALEPACGRGHMAATLAETFAVVTHADRFAYGYGPVRDFLRQPYASDCVDWVITNPPFVRGEAFVLEALRVARRGVAILARSVFAEGVGRYERLFEPLPPAYIATFAERVPMVKGRVDPDATTATAYSWFIWQRGATHTRHIWIRPCRKQLEKPGDYEDPRP